LDGASGKFPLEVAENLLPKRWKICRANFMDSISTKGILVGADPYPGHERKEDTSWSDIMSYLPEEEDFQKWQRLNSVGEICSWFPLLLSNTQLRGGLRSSEWLWGPSC
jgi:hypothetical protein